MCSSLEKKQHVKDTLLLLYQLRLPAGMPAYNCGLFQYASWDLAFHMIPMANVDLHFAKEQLMLFLREWYMHPNGQVCAGYISRVHAP